MQEGEIEAPLRPSLELLHDLRLPTARATRPAPHTPPCALAISSTVASKGSPFARVPREAVVQQHDARRASFGNASSSAEFTRHRTRKGAHRLRGTRPLELVVWNDGIKTVVVEGAGVGGFDACTLLVAVVMRRGARPAHNTPPWALTKRAHVACGDACLRTRSMHERGEAAGQSESESRPTATRTRERGIHASSLASCPYISLAQINLNIPAAALLEAAVVYELQVGTAIPDAVVEGVAYKAEVMAARQMALQVAAGGPPGPLGGAILNAIAALDRKLDGNGNISKGTGYDFPYAEVLFVDGSTSSVPVPAQPGQPGRAALPTLTNVDAVRNLTGPEATRYLIGFGIPAIQSMTYADIPTKPPRRRTASDPVFDAGSRIDI
ncbi:hypothetical protein DFH09DRAFT_1321754 [Mycena vulgaris]|nr:hypothetical protein DFH09DRAFT_1321754 [Mycena vulgaris]